VICFYSRLLALILKLLKLKKLVNNILKGVSHGIGAAVDLATVTQFPPRHSY
jgi:hypothetical protein